MPVENENVEIPPGYNMIFDLAESPILKQLHINGRLTFKNDTDLHLRAKNIFVRSGELIIGYKDAPFKNKARITLYGLASDKTLVYDNQIDAGNKLLSSVGLISMYGLPRKKIHTRLQAPALKGSKDIVLETGLDLVQGDKIALADTSYSSFAGEGATIDTYDAATGKATLKEVLNFYHWGKSESTVAQFGVDMRAEVPILSRNIIIAGDNTESWGGQILTGSMIEADEKLTQRHGITILSNVEIYNCSQADNNKAAVRFEGASNGWSSVTNTSIHAGLGWGVFVKAS